MSVSLVFVMYLGFFRGDAVMELGVGRGLPEIVVGPNELSDSQYVLKQRNYRPLKLGEIGMKR